MQRMELVIKLSWAFPARSPPCRMQSVSLTAGESGQTCWIMGMQKAVASNLFKKCVSFRKPPPPPPDRGIHLVKAQASAKHSDPMCLRHMGF